MYHNLTLTLASDEGATLGEHTLVLIDTMTEEEVKSTLFAVFKTLTHGD